MGEHGPDYDPGGEDKNPESQEAERLAAEFLELMRQVDEPLRKLSPFVEAGNPVAPNFVNKLDHYTDSDVTDFVKSNGPLEQQSASFLRDSN